MDDKKILTITENGIDKEYEILLAYVWSKTGKNYVVYTDNSTDEDGSIRVYASVFDPTGNNPDLLPIETEKEWLVIENILASVQEKIDEAA